MAKLTGALCATAVLFVAVAAPAAEEMPDLHLGKPVREGAFEVYPVLSKRPMRDPGYLLLEDGLKSGVVRIEERKGGGSVPELVLQNTTLQPLYLVAGEVVYGGKQDRVIREDTIIPPLAKDVPLAVFCVEHGRWSGGAAFRASGSFATLKVLKAASFANQGEVWNAVRHDAEKAARAGDLLAATALRRTQTLQGVLASPKAQADVAPFLKAAEGIFAGARTIGFIVAIAGKPQAAHLFASSALARRLGPKLLKSYALEATRGVQGAATAPASLAVVKTFLEEAMKPRGQVRRDLEDIRNLEYDGALGKGKAAVDKRKGQTVHRSYFAH
jgi:hypothetical protein